MKHKLIITLAVAFTCLTTYAPAQEIQTLFKGRVTGYGAISNKFTTIGGDYANIVELYGGVYLNHKFFVGLGGAASTNYLPVAPEYSVRPLDKLSYQYGQTGLVTEYVLGSNKACHFVFHLFSGAGFTLQYDRYGWHDEQDDWFDRNEDMEENWFFVAEPGVQLELNLFRWMRFSPGVTYRAVYGSDARELQDDALSDWSYNVTLKFGKY